jgi:hypothetical protein
VVRRPDTRVIAVAVAYERFRSARSIVGSREIGRITERQEVWLYRCDVDQGTVKKLAVIQAPSVAKRQFQAGIGGWEGEHIDISLLGCSELPCSGPRWQADFRVRSDGSVERIPWIPGTARRPNSGSPGWNEKNFIRLGMNRREVLVYPDLGVAGRPAFRLDEHSKTLVAVR